MRDHWYVAAPAAEVGSEPLSVFVEGEALVLFRGPDGEPRALADRCAHRGMALSRGRVENGRIRCPYHGWCYDGAGRVCDVPALTAAEDPPDVRARAHPALEREEHVWVWLGEGAPKGEPFHFPGWGEPGWSHFFMHNTFEAPVEACLENFLDVPHTHFVHPGLFRQGRSAPTRVLVRRDAASATAEFLNEAPLAGFGPRLVFPRGTSMRHVDRFLAPNISRVDYTFDDRWHFVITSQCTQIDAERTAVTTAIAWKLPRPAWLVRPFIAWYCRRVIRQDVELLEVLGRQLRRFGPTYAHTSADLLGRHISLLRRAAARGESAPPASPVVERAVLEI